MRVLLPRDRPGDPLAAGLADAGLEPVPTTLTTTVPTDPAPVDAALDHLAAGAYAWLAVTSATTVDVLVSRAHARGTTLGDLVGATPVAAVGPATAEALATAGARARLQPHGPSSAADLLAAWPAPPASGAAQVLWPRSAKAAPTLASGLRERGWQVDELTAYDTVPGPPDPTVRADLAAGRVDVVVLTSGTAATALAERYGPLPPSVRVVTIGPVTATAAERAGLAVHAVAAEQTPAGILTALRSLARPPSPTPRP